MSNTTPHDALIYIMVIMSAADRSMTDRELSKIGTIIRTLPVFQDYDSDQLVMAASRWCWTLRRRCRSDKCRYAMPAQLATISDWRSANARSMSLSVP